MCSSMVSPLPSTPWEHVSQGNSSSLDVLERSKKDSPITCQKCHSCQVNKHKNHKYGQLLAKLAITTPWEVLCMDLIGPHTLKSTDKTVIDFMCITMITQLPVGSRLQNCQYHSLVSLIFLWVQRGKKAKTNVSNRKNSTLTNHQKQ